MGTTDGEAAKEFYTELFGWGFDDHSMGPGMVYTMLKQDAKDVGALYQMPGEMTAQGIPPNWLSYVLVASADDAAIKAKSLGATLMKEPFAVMDAGRMAVVQDPTGAVFALWQAGTHKGAGAANGPNSFCWNELATNDVATPAIFTQVFSVGTKRFSRMGPMTYTSFMNGERPAGGMYEPPPEMRNVPPNWLVYFAVDDTDAMLKKAGELGATTIAPPMDIPNTGRFAILQDPQGAAFAIIKLANPPA